MTRFFEHIIGQAVHADVAVQPRPLSRFEPWAAPEVGADWKTSSLHRGEDGIEDAPDNNDPRAHTSDKLEVSRATRPTHPWSATSLEEQTPHEKEASFDEETRYRDSKAGDLSERTETRSDESSIPIGPVVKPSLSLQTPLKNIEDEIDLLADQSVERGRPLSAYGKRAEEVVDWSEEVMDWSGGLEKQSHSVLERPSRAPFAPLSMGATSEHLPTGFSESGIFERDPETDARIFSVDMPNRERPCDAIETTQNSKAQAKTDIAALEQMFQAIVEKRAYRAGVPNRTVSPDADMKNGAVQASLNTNRDDAVVRYVESWTPASLDSSLGAEPPRLDELKKEFAPLYKREASGELQHAGAVADSPHSKDGGHIQPNRHAGGVRPASFELPLPPAPPRPDELKKEFKPFLEERALKGSPWKGGNGARPSENIVNVHIGRIEINATLPERVAPPRKKRVESPVMSLDEYLKLRTHGERS